jgi:mitochondrial import receptor subunit TOM40
MVQFESDYLGKDFSVNLKAINPDPAQNQGIFTISGLQSVSEKVALGGEVIFQKTVDSNGFDQGVNLALKYIPNPKSLFTFTLQQYMALQTSYHHRVSEKVELASELQMLLFGPRKDAVSTVSAKFEYRQSTIRAQLDSTGKIGLLMEEKLFPGFSLLLSGEIDHVKNSSRFGVGLNMEN